MTGPGDAFKPARQAPAVNLTTSAGRVRIERRGLGPAIVLLHDLGTDHRSFAGIIPFLEARREVITPDLIGHGWSDLGALDLSLEAQAEAMIEVLREMGLSRAALVGHSLGGAVAVRMAHLAPGTVSHLVLIAAGSHDYRLPRALRLARSRVLWPAFRLLGGRRALERARAAAFANEPAAAIGRGHPASPASSSWSGWLAFGRAFRQCMSPRAFDEVEWILERGPPQPTLVVWGSNDRVLPPAAARIFFRERRRVRFLEIAGGSHLVHEEHPRAVADIILEFLE